MTSAVPAPLAAIILAAGKGTRMKSGLHKVLHPLAGRPMLLHLIESVAKLGPARTIVIVGAGREQVEAAVARADALVVVQEEQLGTGHAVRQAEGALADFEGAVVALVATGTEEGDRIGYEAAKAAGVAVNVADRPALCDFTLPAVVDRAPPPPRAPSRPG